VDLDKSISENTQKWLVLAAIQTILYGILTYSDGLDGLFDGDWIPFCEPIFVASSALIVLKTKSRAVAIIMFAYVLVSLIFGVLLFLAMLSQEGAKALHAVEKIKTFAEIWVFGAAWQNVRLTWAR
jgi:hypothetical protein